jgi:aryl-phospho-beta-D-glucosidase BglC (GH1 family)
VRFTGFTYDESFVAKLAQAGFKSLRLPIDLDLYVASTAGTGDSLSITVHNDLFTILDAFDAWTKAYGLSLTVDYHQYSTLLDQADPEGGDPVWTFFDRTTGTRRGGAVSACGKRGCCASKQAWSRVGKLSRHCRRSPTFGEI